MKIHDDQAIYVFGFCEPDVPVEHLFEPELNVIGINQGVLRVIATVVSRDEFEGKDAEHNLKDPMWLTPRLYRHSQVLEIVVEAGYTVFPVGFGTLFSSVHALRETINVLSAKVAAALHQNHDCEEWVLEIDLDEDQALEMMLQEGISRGDLLLSDSIGRRHLEVQRYRSHLKDQMPSWILGHLKHFRAPLEGCSRIWSDRPAKSGKVARWAFLVEKGQVDRFNRTIEVAKPSETVWGFDLRLTGPWPPYSFCGAV